VSIKSLVPTVLLMIVVASVGYMLGSKGVPELGEQMNTSMIENAEAKPSPESSSQSYSEEQVKQNILSSIQNLDDTVTEIKIEQSPVQGVYWVLLPDNETLLVSADGRFVLGRNVSEFKADNLEPVLSQVVELAKAGAKKEIINAFKNTEDQQIVYPAFGGKKAEIYVFTDVNCGYCRKFHNDVPELTKAGIEVHYLAGPFFSKDRASLERIWCSEDPLKAMDKAKSGQKNSGVEVTEACVQTVTEHIALGQSLGIRGTPALFTKEGEQLGGYVPPKQLISQLISQ
jgi:thiol:disulfide interchange protein DsbC